MSGHPDTHATDDDGPDREQLRFAVVLNGGVSLAIWMGGAAHELDRLTKKQGAYRNLLDWVHSDARVDVISGTSAGGINGAALAISQCNARSTGLGLLRDVWLESGSIAQLLRQPFRGSPPSLMQGDEYFLPQLNRAMHRLAEPFEARPVAESPLDLTITSTLLRGVPGVVVDNAGQRIAEERHDGLFRFQRGPTHRDGTRGDDFSNDAIAAPGNNSVLDALALAARTTASYPVAFEASYLPATADLSDAAGDKLHPNMEPYLSGAWDQSQGAKRSRFAVDGGVLANTPTRPALEAIDRMPAEGLVRRVLLLVHPHASAPGADTHDDPQKRPTLVGTGAAILGALTAEGSRSFTNLIDEHNRTTVGRRALRAEVVRLAVGDTSGKTLTEQARLAFPWYRLLWAHRVARQLAEMWLARPLSARGPAPETFDQVFAVIVAKVRAVTSSDALPEGDIPAPQTLGFEGALGVADTAVDYLRRALHAAVEAGAQTDGIRAARLKVSAARNEILDGRERYFDDIRDLLDAPLTLAGWLDMVADRWRTVSADGTLSAPLETIANQVAGIHVAPTSSTDHAAATTLNAFSDALDTPTTASAEELEPEDAAHVMRRLNRIQVLTYVVSDEITTGSSLPIDLIQLTYQVAHPFAPGMSGEDKVAGDVLNRFSAFLKRSWRVNDWTWGRLDAAQVLCRTALETDRVRRYIAMNQAQGQSFADAAAEAAQALMKDDFDLAGVPTRDELIQELRSLDPAAPEPRARPLQHLPAVFAAHLALEIAAEELPELVRSVDYDESSGTNARSRGSVNVKANRDLLAGAGTGTPESRWASLSAFANAGIGTESLTAEATSDQMITTATTAAATALTVLDGDQSGLRFLKPVTRTMRGGALLPYWAINGLTTGGVLARGLAVLGLSIGAVLFALGMLGFGPRWGIAVGAAAVLGAFAYGALRTGTALHSAVLLVPAVSLLAWAAQSDAATTVGSSQNSAHPFWILIALTMLVVGLIVLGSIKPPTPSPLAWFGTNRTPVIRFLIGLAVVLVLFSAPVRAAVAEAVETLVSDVDETTGWVRLLLVVVAIALVVGYLSLGARYAYRAGVAWRLLVLAPVAPGSSVRTWRHDDVEHPAGVTAGWSWVYGTVMAILVAGFAVAASLGAAWTETPVALAGATGLVAGALLLVLPVPWFIHSRAAEQLRQRAVGVFARRADATSNTEKIAALFSAGLNYAQLVQIKSARPDPQPIWSGLALSPAAERAWTESRHNG